MAVYRQFPNWLGRYVLLGSTRLKHVRSRQDPLNFVIIGAIGSPNGHRIGWRFDSSVGRTLPGSTDRSPEAG